MVDTLAHTVAEHTLGSVKIEKLINSFANKLAHVAATALGDTLTYVQVEAVFDTLPHTLKEMQPKVLVDSLADTLVETKPRHLVTHCLSR